MFKYIPLTLLLVSGLACSIGWKETSPTATPSVELQLGTATPTLNQEFIPGATLESAELDLAATTKAELAATIDVMSTQVELMNDSVEAIVAATVMAQQPPIVSPTYTVTAVPTNTPQPTVTPSATQTPTATSTPMCHVFTNETLETHRIVQVGETMFWCQNGEYVPVPTLTATHEG